MAKLDKADRSLCFTSGMAALSAVTHLVAPGASLQSFIFFSFSHFEALVVSHVIHENYSVLLIIICVNGIFR